METESIYEAMASRRKVEQGKRAWKYIRDLSSLTVGDLGLRHAIILHVPIAGPAAIPMLTAG